MSYINEALRKSQKEKKTPYSAYDHIVSAPRKKIKKPQKWLSVVGILIVFFYAAGMIILLQGIEDKKAPEIKKLRIPPGAPVVVADRPLDKKVELQPQRTTAKARTTLEIAEAKSLFAQALERQREGKLEEAKKLYRKVVEFDQYNVQAFNNLGVIYMGQKNYRRAIMRFNDALNMKRDYVDAHYNLACLYAQNNDVKQSLFYLENAIEYNPEVRQWARNDGDLKALANLPEFKKLMEKQSN